MILYQKSKIQRDLENEGVNLGRRKRKGKRNEKERKRGRGMEKGIHGRRI